MNRIRFSFLTILALIVFACSNETEKQTIDEQQIDYDDLLLDIQENVISLDAMLEYDEDLKQTVNVYRETGDESVFQTSTFQKTASRLTEKETVEYTVDDLSEVYTDKQKGFLVDFYNEFANSKDGNILDIVINYKNELNNQDFSLEEYSQIETLLVASEQSILVLDGIIEIGEGAAEKSSFSAKGSCGFWCCMRKKAGKAIGRGIVTGAITGAIVGAKIGATGGTVALPGVGTATGAVGGAVFGAAANAIRGAAAGAIWTAVDCGAGGGLAHFIKENVE